MSLRLHIVSRHVFFLCLSWNRCILMCKCIYLYDKSICDCNIHKHNYILFYVHSIPVLSTEAATAAIESAHANYALLNRGGKICRGRNRSYEQGLKRMSPSSREKEKSSHAGFNLFTGLRIRSSSSSFIFNTVTRHHHGCSQSSDQLVERGNTADTTRSAPWVTSTGAFISFTFFSGFVAGSSRKNGIWLTNFINVLNSRYSKTKRYWYNEWDSSLNLNNLWRDSITWNGLFLEQSSIISSCGALKYIMAGACSSGN